jgi:hypothetical protein
VQNNVLKTNAL